MFHYYIIFWYYDNINRCKIKRTYRILFDFNKYKIDLEEVRNHFIDDLLYEMKFAKATKYYIQKSGILPD